MTMGQRITVLRDGKIQQVGTPQEVYEHPANVFVATFIGTPPMNIVHATVSEGMLRASSFSLPISSRHRALLREGQRVTLGIRPEHIARGTPGNVQATVDVVEPIGHESIVYASAGDERLVAIFDPQETPRAGDTISLDVDAEQVHVFDGETEKAIG